MNAFAGHVSGRLHGTGSPTGLRTRATVWAVVIARVLDPAPHPVDIVALPKTIEISACLGHYVGFDTSLLDDLIRMPALLPRRLAFAMVGPVLQQQLPVPHNLFFLEHQSPYPHAPAAVFAAREQLGGGRLEQITLFRFGTTLRHARHSLSVP